MRALAVYPAEKRIEVVEHPEPRIESPDEIKLRMLDIGICGTDREIIEQGHGTPPEGSKFLILGHESLGEVVEAGPEAKGFQSGDLAVVSVRRPCHHPECTACRQGRSDFCYTGDYTERGIKGLHGFMAEFVVDSARYMTRLPQGLREVGVLIEPLTIAEKALIQVREIQERLPWACTPSGPQGRYSGHACRRAVVLGAGPVGLLGAMLFRAAGFQTWVYSRSPAPNPKAELAEAIGATYISSEEVPPDRLLDHVGPIDFIYEALGGAPIAFEVLKHLGRNGIFIFTGVPGRKTPLPLDINVILGNMVSRNQVVLGTVNAGPDAFEAAVRDLEEFTKQWPEAVRNMITTRVPLSQAPELLTGKSGGAIKEVVSPALAEA